MADILRLLSVPFRWVVDLQKLILVLKVCAGGIRGCQHVGHSHFVAAVPEWWTMIGNLFKVSSTGADGADVSWFLCSRSGHADWHDRLAHSFPAEAPPRILTEALT